jgi:enediyne biosynthesis protein E11
MAAGAAEDFDAAVHALLAPYLGIPPTVLLTRWRSERAAATSAVAALPPDRMVPWVARSIPAGVLACAGILAPFAHVTRITSSASHQPGERPGLMRNSQQ